MTSHAWRKSPRKYSSLFRPLAQNCQRGAGKVCWWKAEIIGWRDEKLPILWFTQAWLEGHHPSVVRACCGLKLKCYPNLMVKAWLPDFSGTSRVWCTVDNVWSLRACFRRNCGIPSFLPLSSGPACTLLQHMPPAMVQCPTGDSKQPGQFTVGWSFETKQNWLPQVFLTEIESWIIHRPSMTTKGPNSPLVRDNLWETSDHYLLQAFILGLCHIPKLSQFRPPLPWPQRLLTCSLLLCGPLG